MAILKGSAKDMDICHDIKGWWRLAIVYQGEGYFQSVGQGYRYFLRNTRPDHILKVIPGWLSSQGCVRPVYIFKVHMWIPGHYHGGRYLQGYTRITDIS